MSDRIWTAVYAITDHGPVALLGDLWFSFFYAARVAHAAFTQSFWHRYRMLRRLRRLHEGFMEGGQ
jgi:hypothetical protein